MDDNTLCGTSCVDIKTNPSHCGACGTTCATGESCRLSTCWPGGFPGSRIVDKAQGVKINTWVGTPNWMWNLCYSKSIHGASAATFHKNCDDMGKTLTIAKLTSTAGTRIMGGYAASSWSGTGYSYDLSAFLFSLTSDHRYDLYTAHDKSVYRDPTKGPAFGAGYDFIVDGTMNGGSCNLGGSYACRVGTFGSSTCRDDLCGTFNTWTVAELEVWTK
jgi:hypothetical protein